MCFCELLCYCVSVRFRLGFWVDISSFFPLKKKLQNQHKHHPCCLPGRTQRVTQKTAAKGHAHSHPLRTTHPDSTHYVLEQLPSAGGLGGVGLRVAYQFNNRFALRPEELAADVASVA